MSRSTLKFLAVLLAVLIVAVLFSGLDSLPREVRAQISTERNALAAAQSTLTSERDRVTREVSSDAALFAAVASSRQWPGQFDQAQSTLQSASRDMDELTRLEKSNRRQDRARVETLLAQERNRRTSAVAPLAAIDKEATRWVEWKKHLPEDVRQMEADYQTVHGFELAPVAATVQKAETDWPQKKSDLESRLAADRALAANADQAWQSSADARRAVAAGDYAHDHVAASRSAAATRHPTA